MSQNTKMIVYLVSLSQLDAGVASRMSRPVAKCCIVNVTLNYNYSKTCAVLSGAGELGVHVRVLA